MPIKVKGVSSLRTLGAIRGCGSSNERHVFQFQIASLELERSRREKERDVAMNRIKAIDDRVMEIDSLIRKHLEALGTPSYLVSTRNVASTAISEKRRTLRY